MEEPIRIKVSSAWKRFIIFVQNECPEGNVWIEVAGGEPKKTIVSNRLVRFDKPLPQYILERAVNSSEE